MLFTLIHITNNKQSLPKELIHHRLSPIVLMFFTGRLGDLVHANIQVVTSSAIGFHCYVNKALPRSFGNMTF